MTCWIDHIGQSERRCIWVLLDVCKLITNHGEQDCHKGEIFLSISLSKPTEYGEAPSLKVHVLNLKLIKLTNQLLHEVQPYNLSTLMISRSSLYFLKIEFYQVWKWRLVGTVIVAYCGMWLSFFIIASVKQKLLQRVEYNDGSVKL